MKGGGAATKTQFESKHQTAIFCAMDWRRLSPVDLTHILRARIKLTFPEQWIGGQFLSGRPKI